jgi:hypothetical protein
MPVSTDADLRVDALLTNLSIGYGNNEYIADQIFPIVTVTEKSGLVPRFKRSHWFRDEARERAPKSRSVGGGPAVDEPLSYAVRRYSWRDEIDDDTRKASASVYDLEQTSVNFVTDKLQLRRENLWASSYFKEGVWGEDLIGGTDFNQWSDYADSSPLTDITDQNDDLELRIGREGNTAVMGKKVLSTLRWHPDLIDANKTYNRAGVPTIQGIADLMGLSRILVGRSIITHDPEGTAEADVTYERIWGPHVLLMYLTDRAVLNQPAAGYTLIWEAYPNALQWMKRMRDEEREVDIIEGNSYFQQVQTSVDAGLFMKNVVAV